MANREASKTKKPRKQDDKRFMSNPAAVTLKVREVMQSSRAISLSDVTIITADDAKIPAIRTLLVIRSPYFEKLLTPNLAWKGRSAVNVSLSATALRQVLDFIYTDDSPLIRELLSAAERFERVPCNAFHQIIELADAADYTEMEKLLQWCKDTVSVAMERNLHSPCVVLQKLNDSRTPWRQKLLECAYETFVRSPDILLCRCNECHTQIAVKDFSPRLLERILEKICLEHNAHFEMMFQVIIVWASVAIVLVPKWERYVFDDPFIFIDVTKVSWDSALVQVAKRLVKRFDFTQFSATILAQVVEKSGLLGDRDIIAAYRQRALQFEEREKKRRRS